MQMNDDLQSGYTTGTYAAAVSKGASLLLLTGKKLKNVKVTLPSGALTEPIKISSKITGDRAVCSALKESPESMDATNRLEIVASAKMIDNKGVTVVAGQGIGHITRPGLQVEPGKPAINPVPLAMIKQEVRSAVKEADYEGGVEITLSVPEGKEASQLTFNPRLGIEGGISIIGTTGILRPMSFESLKVSLTKQVDVAAAEGHKKLILVPGNLGETVALQRLNSKNIPILQANNLFGEMLLRCRDLGVDSVLLLGHIGKLAKLGDGQMNTHSRFRDHAVKALIRTTRKLQGYQNKLAAFLTTEEAAKFILKEEPDALDRLARNCGVEAEQFAGPGVRVSIALTMLDGSIIARHVADKDWENILCFT